MTAPAWRAGEGGFVLRVRVTPNASKDAIEGAGSDAAGETFLKVRVRAVPEKGRANVAVEKLIAKALGLPKSAVSVEKGETQRLKTISILGEADVEARLRDLLQQQELGP